MRPLQTAPRVASSIPLVVALALGGCGGSTESQAPGGDGQDSRSSAAASAAASVTPPSAATGGEDAASAEAVADALAPPNANETSRTTSGGLVLITHESSESIDSLVSYYETAIPKAGMSINAKTTADDGANFVFGSGNLNGSVTFISSSETPGGTSVSVSVLDTSV